MKKIAISLIAILGLFSCKPEHPKEYLSISGKIQNNIDSVLIITGFAVKKKIKISKDGSFKDSLKVAKANFYPIATSSGKRGYLYLKNGYDLTISSDGNNFYRSFRFEGSSEGADSNNLLIDHLNFNATMINPRDLFELEQKAFLEKLNYYKNGIDSIAEIYKNANEDMSKNLHSQSDQYFQRLEDNYDRNHTAVLKEKAALAKIEKGKVAPEFNDYIDYKGGKKSLKDFRGNYIYIDVWATWCKPCIAQIPFLKKLEEEYKDANIKIVSISTDNDRRSGGDWNKAKEKWRTMVKEKNMSGVQLWAGKDEMRFSEDYVITGIPRFILIDPEGKIVDANAPRPFDPNLKKLFTSLGI